jgi:hypothetical protein
VKRPPTTNNESKDDTKRDDPIGSKPPLPTPPSVNTENTYSTINQKLREYITKYKTSTSSDTRPNEVTSHHVVLTNAIADNTVAQQNSPIKVQPYKNAVDGILSQEVVLKNDNSLNKFNNKYGSSIGGASGDTNQPKKFFFTKFNFAPLQDNNAKDMSNQQHVPNAFNDTQMQMSNELNTELRKFNLNRNLPKSPVNNASIVQIHHLPRPYSANTPSVTHHIAIKTPNNQGGVIYQNHHTAKINSKFLPVSFTPITAPTRIYSADYINPQLKFKRNTNK